MSIVHFPKLSNNAWKYIDCAIDKEPIKNFLSFSLFHYLTELNIKKREISDLWNEVSENANEYAHVSQISVYKPLSNLYFEILEITHCIRFNFKDYKAADFVMFSFSPNMYDAIEPIQNLRKNQNDKYYGFSIPISGKSPNIYTLNNSTFFSIDQYKNCADLIYCEGGDKNVSEQLRFEDLFLEITQAVCTQAHKGTIIVKLHDCFLRTTAELIFILSSMYEKTYIIKPNVSNVYSSERFLVCNNFLFSNYKDYYHFFEKIANIIKLHESFITSLLPKIQLPVFFKNKMDECNTIIGQQQLENMYRVLEIIENKKNNMLVDISSADIYPKQSYRANMRNSILWCEKYGVEYFKNADYDDNHNRPNIFRHNNV
jgi:hypothetical protein